MLFELLFLPKLPWPSYIVAHFQQGEVASPNGILFLVVDVDTIKAPMLQLVVHEVANKFAGSHFQRGVRERIVRHLTTIIIDYVQVSSSSHGSGF